MSSIDNWLSVITYPYKSVQCSSHCFLPPNISVLLIGLCTCQSSMKTGDIISFIKQSPPVCHTLYWGHPGSWIRPHASLTFGNMPVGELVLLAIFLLLWPKVQSTESSSGCQRMEGIDPHVLAMDGDVILGGLFPLHYITPKPDHVFTDQPQVQRCSGWVIPLVLLDISFWK